VAGVVGALAAGIFGYRNAQTLEYAEKLGLAFQLTNIIRDVGEDARKNRIYLPWTSSRSPGRCAWRSSAAGARGPRRSSAGRARPGRRTGARSSRLIRVENVRRRHPVLLELVHGKIDAVLARVLAHVADDVGELEREPELLGVLERLRVAVAENARCKRPTTPATRWQ